MDLSKGRIIFASSNSYTVLTDENREYLCVLSGNFSKENKHLPTVGDYVEFQPSQDGQSVIKTLGERNSVISRKASGREFKDHTLAANVDYLLIVNALDDLFSKRRIERFMVLASSGGVTPVIILSKADMCNPLDMAMYLMGAEEAAGSAEIIEVSSVTGAGFERLEEILSPGVTACVAGLSGAGKSTMINRLCGGDVRETTEVRENDGRGRHCTTDRHMFRTLSGGMIIDTPGIREVGIQGNTEAVADVFEEVLRHSPECFFSDCTHTHEPSCAVIKAVETGEISRERYESYIKLRSESENYRMRTEKPQEIRKAGKRLSKLVKSVTKRKNRF